MRYHHSQFRLQTRVMVEITIDISVREFLELFTKQRDTIGMLCNLISTKGYPLPLCDAKAYYPIL